MQAASSEAPKDRRYEPRARGLRITRTNSLQCMEATISTRAASGISTIALKKKVVNPKVSPKPGSTLGWRIAAMIRRRAARAAPAPLQTRCGGSRRRSLVLALHDQHRPPPQLEQGAEALRQAARIVHAQNQHLA